jgi:hypothetical protein
MQTMSYVFNVICILSVLLGSVCGIYDRNQRTVVVRAASNKADTEELTRKQRNQRLNEMRYLHSNLAVGRLLRFNAAHERLTARLLLKI